MTDRIYSPSKIHHNTKNGTQKNLSWRLRSNDYFRSSSQAATHKLQLRGIIKK